MEVKARFDEADKRFSKIILLKMELEDRIAALSQTKPDYSGYTMEQYEAISDTFEKFECFGQMFRSANEKMINHISRIFKCDAPSSKYVGCMPKPQNSNEASHHMLTKKAFAIVLGDCDLANNNQRSDLPN